MNKSYQLKKVRNSSYEYICFSTDYSRMEEYLNDVELDLRKKSASGTVLFDLLLSNGISSTRYLSIFFNGNEFDIQTIKVVSVTDELKDSSLKFYASKNDLLQYSVLTKTQQYLIKHKLIVW